MKTLTTSVLLAVLGVPGLASAAEPGEGEAGFSLGGEASASTEDGAEASGDADADAGGEAQADQEAADEGKSRKSRAADWFKLYRPTRNMFEVGIYGGVLLPSSEHELYSPDPDVAGFGHQAFQTVAPDIGIRGGFYPLSFLGVELEVGVMPTSTVMDGESAILYTFRGLVLAQLPYRLAPFVRLGYGALGASTNSIGGDIDPAINVGAGLKFYINRWLLVRLDIVDNIASRYQIDEGFTQHWEILLGLSVALNRRKPEELIDRDGDGLYDPGQGLDVEDKCPRKPGPPENDGCPWPDTDEDGVLDKDDKCPEVAGPRENDGCPWPDTDSDGILDKDDDCPKEAGPKENKGCPWPDTDADGIVDKDDKCVSEPETKNGYQDKDGCPDTPPAKLKAFSGIIEGIYFDVNKDTIKKSSRRTLDKAVKVLEEFKDQRVEVGGHTDTDGSRELNVDLSQRRAESVKKYLIDKGIDESRIEAKGYGPDKPIADNDTKKGKAKNRRIEFKLIQ